MSKLDDALLRVTAADLTPWLAITQRQVKLLTLVVIGIILLAVAAFVAFRLVRRMRWSAEGLDEPVEPISPGMAPVVDDPPRRVVDAAIANLLEQAAPIDGDERSGDELYVSVVRITVELGGVSIPAIQRRLHLDFDRASGFVERMAEEGLLTEPGPGGKRKVTPAAESFVERLGPGQAG